MDVAPSSRKRPIETEQPSVDTFAVCTSCSRLSRNLQKCDKCDSPLSNDSTAVCYSADPKKNRVDSHSSVRVNGSFVNGRCTPEVLRDTINGNSFTEDSTTDTSTAIPQVLYVNKNATSLVSSSQTVISSSSDTVPSTANTSSLTPVIPTSCPIRPQALYLNVNHPSLSSLRSNHQPVISSSSCITNINGSSTPSMSSSSFSFAGVSRDTVSTSVAASAISQRQHQNQTSSHIRPDTSVSTLATVSDINSTSTVGAALPSSANHLSSSTGVGSSGAAVCQVEENGTVLITGQQIRIGAKKFQPTSPISFKSDGILFTLKDCEFAPVLLNTRAIVTCKACLSAQFPLVFLYLEQSCMKQIRKIFSLSTSDFYDQAKWKVKKCITIFLQIPPSSTSSSLSMLKDVLTTMFAKVPASFQKISEEEAVDDLLDNACSEEVFATVNGEPQSTPTTSASATTARRVVPATTVTTSVNSLPAMTSISQPYMGPGQLIGQMPLGVSGMQLNASYMPPYLASNSHVPPLFPNPVSNAYLRPQMAAMTSLQQMPRSASMSSLQSSRPLQMMTAASNAIPMGTRPPNTTLPLYNRPSTPQTVGNTLPPGSTTTAPLLVIPANTQQWLQLQKNLVSGGVYHVQLPDGTKKYCLWNGSSLVPCLVQNSEITLECSTIRVGSCIFDVTSTVRIVIDNKLTIMLIVRDPQSNCNANIVIGQDDLSKSLICFESVMLIFLTLKPTAVERIRLTLHLTPDKFHVNTAVENCKYIILWLRNVSAEQKEAMVQYRDTRQKSSGQKFFEEITAAKCRQMLQGVITSSAQKSNTSTAVAHLCKLPLENIAKKVFSSDSSMVTDDDDDVIMTSEEVGIKCPYTQQIMKEPIRNKICGHNYEKAAICEFIQRKKGVAKCPYSGCGNTTPLSTAHLEDNLSLKLYISQQLEGK